MGPVEEHDVATGGERIVNTATGRGETVRSETSTPEWWLMTFFIGAIEVLMGVRSSLREMLGI